MPTANPDQLELYRRAIATQQFNLLMQAAGQHRFKNGEPIDLRGIDQKNLSAGQPFNASGDICKHWQGLYLQNTTFEHAIFINGSFGWTENLSGADFGRSDFRGAHFYEAKLHGADFQLCELPLDSFFKANGHAECNIMNNTFHVLDPISKKFREVKGFDFRNDTHFPDGARSQTRISLPEINATPTVTTGRKAKKAFQEAAPADNSIHICDIDWKLLKSWNLPKEAISAVRKYQKQVFGPRAMDRDMPELRMKHEELLLAAG